MTKLILSIMVSLLGMLVGVIVLFVWGMVALLCAEEEMFRE